MQYSTWEASLEQVSGPGGVYISPQGIGYSTLGAEGAQVVYPSFSRGNVYTTWARNLLRGGLPGGVVYTSGVLIHWMLAWDFTALHLIRELEFRRTVISGILPFRRPAPRVSFRQCLWRFTKIGPEMGGRPSAPPPRRGQSWVSPETVSEIYSRGVPPKWQNAWNHCSPKPEFHDRAKFAR